MFALLKLPLGDHTNGTQVHVGWDDETIFDCGSTSETAPGVWIKFQCPSGTEGNRVMVINPLHNLNMCEIKIYGPSKFFPDFEARCYN